MTINRLVVDDVAYEPLQTTEEQLEGLLRASSRQLFGGLSYEAFRPPIPSRWGTRHPDGALLAPPNGEWWVVEVELHNHDPDRHIRPQLEALADGRYGPKALSYLERTGRFETREIAALDAWDPRFLLIVDHATPTIRAIAIETGFAIVECTPYRSVQNRYALAVTGDVPAATKAALPGGMDFILSERSGVALLTPTDDELPARLPQVMTLGDRRARARVTGGRQSIVLPMKQADVERTAGVADRYRLTSEDRLVPAGRPRRR